MGQADELREMAEEMRYDKEHRSFMDSFDSAIGNAMKSKEGIDATLKERGNRYGSFELQLYCVSQIVDSMVSVYMDKHKEMPTMNLVSEWHYLAIKMARIPASPEYTDNYHDLAGYSKLLEEKYASN